MSDHRNERSKSLLAAGARPGAVALLGLLALAGANARSPTSHAVTSSDRAVCDFGRPLDERVVLRPRAGTFYSVDVLNPDVVRWKKQFFLFFSGNRARSDAGAWRTGLAISSHAAGPYRVDGRMRAHFFNGGTAVVSRHLYQAATSSRGPALFRTRNGISWTFVSAMPAGGDGSWRRFESDLYPVARKRRLDVYFAGRPGASGADIGRGTYTARSWRRFDRVLVRQPNAWDSEDLGEPALFAARGHSYMLYAGLSAPGTPRQIGLAYWTPMGWRRCNGPFIPAGGRSYPRNAIDPEPLVLGHRLFVFFGGGRTASLGGGMHGVIVLRTYAL